MTSTHDHQHDEHHRRPGPGPGAEHDTGLAALLDLDAALGALNRPGNSGDSLA